MSSTDSNAKDLNPNMEMRNHQNRWPKQEELDEHELRIQKTGCYQENEALQNCFAEKHDWRDCQDILQKFKKCWEKRKEG
ncbi:hypothetical protein G9A89_012844 [Geosiphon pyriformis]|nr:hypothetical protein G9A89_012844 [Geosiphon pyriformis]